MGLFDLFRSRKHTAARPVPHGVLRLETLEDRVVPAVTLSNRVLSVVGTEQNDVIVVETQAGRVDDLQVTVYDRTTGAIRERQNELDPQDDRFDRLVIEGRSGADILINWTPIPARILGGTSVDTLQGGFGQDTLEGGDGDDRYFYSRAPFDQLPLGIVVNDSNASWGEQLGTDTIVEGTSAAAGVDILDLERVGAGVQVNLVGRGTQAVAPGRLSLNLPSVPALEHVFGTPFDDVLLGSQATNLLVGGDGNDVLEGRGGDDFLFGDAGGDTYVFGSGSLGHDTILESVTGIGQRPDVLDLRNLDNGANVDLSAVGRRITISRGILDLTLSQRNSATSNGIENVLGTRFRDFLFGNELDNRLEGGQDSDTLFGLDGRDILIGGAGTDYLYGGNQDDELYGYIPWVIRVYGVDREIAANDVLDGGAGSDRNEVWVVILGRSMRRRVYID